MHVQMNQIPNSDDKKTITIITESSSNTKKKDNCLKTKTFHQLPTLTHREQVILINQLFLKYDSETNELNVVIENTTDQYIQMYMMLISKKITGYKQQDVNNTIYDDRWFISMSELLEILVSSKLICYYCRDACYVHYTEPHSSSQWTLDRISNDHGHNRNNVVISCLKCNLKRGMKSSEKFKLGKQLRFIKI
jgi:hypothetical protein